MSPTGDGPRAVLRSLAERVSEACEACRGRDAVAEVGVGPTVPLADGPPPNQFLLLLKPEATELHRQGRLRLLELVLGALAQFRAHLVAVRVLSGPYAARAGVIEANYHVLDAVARRGRDALSARARARLRAMYRATVGHDAEIFGAFEFLERWPGFSSASLEARTDEVGTVKLGSGAYAVTLAVEGRRVVVLNGFYPQQRARLTASAGVLVALACVSTRRWAELRARLVGSIEPARAQRGSLRRELFERAGELGARDICLARNGFHISPGPLDAVFALESFFGWDRGDPRVDLARRLARRGVSRGFLSGLRNSLTVPVDGAELPVLDLTEDRDAGEVLELVTRLWHARHAGSGPTG